MDILKEYSKEVLNIDDGALKGFISDITNKLELEVKGIKEILGVSELRAREIVLKEKYGTDIRDLDKELKKSERYFKREVLKKKQETLKLEVVK